MMMAVHEMPGVLSYPRTGKRGVPQQFPRRLYTMLESESSCPSDPPLIQWSHSGQAFRIVDIEQFSTDVLPKYFRTSKFSSFQRNLNLVSFSSSVILNFKIIIVITTCTLCCKKHFILELLAQREAIAISYFLVFVGCWLSCLVVLSSFARAFCFRKRRLIILE